MKGWHPPATKVFTVRLDICGETCKGLSSKKASAREARKNSRLRRGERFRNITFKATRPPRHVGVIPGLWENTAKGYPIQPAPEMGRWERL